MTRGPLPRTIVLAAFGIGLALQLVQAWMVGDQRWMPQHVAQFAAGAAVWWLATWPGLRWAFRVVAVTFLLVMVSAYVLNAFGALPWLNFAPGQRNGLWWRDPNLLGIALASTAALAAMLKTRARWLAAVLWGLALAVAVASWTRGAALSILIGGATWAWTRFRGRDRLRIGVLGVAMIVALGVGAWFAPESVAQLFGPMTVERFVGGGVVDPRGTGGVFARARAHEAGWTIAARTWPWGAGFGGFGEAYLTYVEPGARHALEHAHHQLIQLLAEGGVLGLLAWMIPVVATAWRLNARGWWVLAPFIAVQAVLWGIESPLLFAGAFYATWAALGLAWQASRGAWPISAPCVQAVTAAGTQQFD